MNAQERSSEKKEAERILTINNQLSFGGDLADTVLRLAHINSLVAGDDVFYNQTFISIQNFGPRMKNGKQEINK